MDTKQLLTALMEKDATLDDILKSIPDLTFTDYLETLMDRSLESRAQIIKDTTLDRNYAYQIIGGQRVPGRNKVLAFALALSLSQEDTERLLKLAHQGGLYPKIKRDAIIIYSLAHHYNVMETNELLDDHGEEIIK